MCAEFDPVEMGQAIEWYTWNISVNYLAQSILNKNYPEESIHPKIDVLNDMQCKHLVDTLYRRTKKIQIAMWRQWLNEMNIPHFCNKKGYHLPGIEKDLEYEPHIIIPNINLDFVSLNHSNIDDLDSFEEVAGQINPFPSSSEKAMEELLYDGNRVDDCTCSEFELEGEPILFITFSRQGDYAVGSGPERFCSHRGFVELVNPTLQNEPWEQNKTPIGRDYHTGRENWCAYKKKYTALTVEPSQGSIQLAVTKDSLEKPEQIFPNKLYVTGERLNYEDLKNLGIGTTDFGSILGNRIITSYYRKYKDFFEIENLIDNLSF